MCGCFARKLADSFKFGNLVSHEIFQWFPTSHQYFVLGLGDSHSDLGGGDSRGITQTRAEATPGVSFRLGLGNARLHQDNMEEWVKMLKVEMS